MTFYQTVQSIQGIVPFTVNGQTFYTHSSWLSEKQYNGWVSVPRQNKNLACNYALSALACTGIFFRKTALVKSVLSSYGRLILGTGGFSVVSYFGILGLLKSQEASQYERLVSRNDCGSTPMWRNEEGVVNLREKDYNVFMSRRDGTTYNVKDVKKYNPDCVLTGKANETSIEKLV